MKNALFHAPLALAALAGAATSQSFYQPPEAVDFDPSPNVVEYRLTADETTWEYTPGVPTTVWAYNGSTPGPTLRADLGDTIRVVFTNALDEPTTIHWHGVETPAHVDGAHISQAHVQPGETFTYEWTAINAGMHWYHPHVRTNDQVEKGLHGVLIIRDPATETALGFSEIPQRIVVFDDVLLDTNNQIVPALSFTNPLQNAVHQLNGREGNLLLVNGKAAGSGITMNVPNGVPVRWRVVNVANSTFCRLDLKAPEVGLGQLVWQVASDGGFTESPYPRKKLTSTAPPPPPGGEGPDHPTQALTDQMDEGIFLMPGERMDVIFTPIGADGQTVPVFQNDWYRGRHTASYSTAGNIVLGLDPLDGLYPRQLFLNLVLNGPDPGNGEYVPPASLRTFPTLPPPQGNLPFFFGHGDPNPTSGDVTFFAQAEMISGVMNPLPTAKITSFKAHDVQVGETWQWEVWNLSHGEHPFHTHGFPFELVEYEFFDMDDPLNNWLYSTDRRMLKDTIRVPPRLGAKGRSKTVARLNVTFDDTGREGQVVAQGEQATFDQTGAWTSGGWLAHCHILEHSARGMLTFFELRDPADPFQLLGSFHPSTLGNASLTASGTLMPGSNLTFHLVDAKPNTTVFLCAGNIAANRSLAGGNFVPGLTSDGTTVLPKPLFARVFTFSTGGSGTGSFTTTAWEAAPPGTTTYWQVAFKDTGLPGNWAYSNALMFTRP